jgi:hypothetical protein
LEKYVRHQSRGWVATLSSGNAEALWTKLYDLISKHSAVRNLYSPSRLSYDRLKDIYCDLTQDLFLRLYVKGRWQYYIDAGYTDGNIEHELHRIEVPNLVSRMLREQYPEAYRIARRTSILLQTRSEFKRYDRPYWTSNGSNRLRWARANRKLVSQVYGLSIWPLDRPMKCEQEISELVKNVAFRRRDTRRTGRGSGSQVIISNEELSQLIVEIFLLIDSPADVRTIRQIVLSRLTIEDSRFVPIDASAGPEKLSEKDPPQLDLADERPTPEDALLEKEASRKADETAEAMLEGMKRAVRNKPHRYSKLIDVVWHCYFNPSGPTQTDIARYLNISASLVSHYRKIFDSYVQNMNLSLDELKLINNVFGERLNKIVTTSPPSLAARDESPPEQRRLYEFSHKPMAAAASATCRR